MRGMEPTESKPLVVRDQPPVEANALTALIDRVASDPNYPVEKLREMFALKERYDANEARKAFVVALNLFKANAPEIVKNKQVDFTSAKGRTHYKHASLDQVSGVIGAALAKVGMSHRWNVEHVEGDKIRVTCILTHALGHSESVTLPAVKADDSGNKNSIQGVGSAITYLQRYSLLAVTGMAVRDADDDGQGGNSARSMDEKARETHLANIAAAPTGKELEALWAVIASDCTKAGDVTAYEELKKEVIARAKALKKAEAAI